MRKTFALILAAAVVAPIAVLDACTTNAAVAKGGACTQSIDCQEKLVCIYASDASTTGTCTDDLGSIVDVPDIITPEAQGFDVVVTDSPAIVDQSAPKDNNVPETTPQDTGSPTDAGNTDGD